MATIETRAELITIVVAMFDAAPGVAVLSDLTAASDAGNSNTAIAASLANSAEFKSIFPTFLANSEFVGKLVDQMVGNLVVAAEKDAIKTILTAEMNAGATRVDVVLTAVAALKAIPETDSVWGNAAAAFNNKVEVATFHTVEKQQATTSLADLQEVLATIDNTEASVTSAKSEITGDAEAGQSLSLTGNQDTLTGGAGNDTFTAGAAQDGNGTLINTLQGVDVLDGGAGTDTINITLTGGAVVAPSMSNIENVTVRVTNAADSLSLSGASGVTNVTVANSTVASTAATGTVSGVAGAALTVKNQSNAVSFDGSTGSALTLTFDTVGSSSARTAIDLGKATAAKATSATITANNAHVNVDSTAADVFTSATVAATGSNTIDFTDSAATLTSLTVSGAGSLKTSNVDLTKVATLTAGDGGVTFKGGSAATSFSATTGSGKDSLTVAGTNLKSVDTGAGNDSVTVSSALAATSTVTLGAGDDTITLQAAPSAGATITAGDGTDTIGLALADYTTVSGYSSTNLAKISGFEVLSITDALTAAVNVSKLSGITSFQTVGATGAQTVSGLGANASVTLNGDIVTNNGALTLTMTDATGSSDVLNLTLNHKAALASNSNTAVTSTVAVAGVETLNVNTGVTSTTAGATNVKATYTLALGATATSLATLDVNGSQAVSFTSNAALTKLATVDASDNTGGVTIDASAATAAAAALTITGSATAANTLTGGAKGDTLIGGSKGDTLTGGAGADTLTGGAGNDIFAYTAANQSNLIALDTITDFSANTFGNGTNGAAGTGATTTVASRTGDVLSFDVAAAQVTAGALVSVQSNASDAQTFLQNTAANGTANQVGVALDSSSNRLYVDWDSDGTADSVIVLTGVTTIDAAAILLV
ncbi:MAG: hypothetical protein CMQ34_03225 [Gammaproteobacteria bacterium]|nr:hypothetical protein [Gammaproteobacteria bacterium]|tara:strand:+ start:1554 stop:4205 length:2652 start_codon:yes stop_codon:yes gene_type:complete